MNETNEAKELLLKAMKACSGREYCINDVRTMLDKWGADNEETKEKIIRRLPQYAQPVKPLTRCD